MATLDYNEYLSLVAYSCIIAAYNIGWITFAYIFLDLIEPKLRATANGLVICVVRLIGDSISPYWVGSIADACLNNNNSNNQENAVVRTVANNMKCTQYSFYPLVFVSFVGGVMALSGSFTFKRDRERAIKTSVIKSEQEKKEIRF